MRGLIVALLASCLLLADDVVLQSTARLQSASRIYTGDEEKTNTTQIDTVAPHIRYNRVHIVTSPPISVKSNQTEATVSTNTVDTESINKGFKEEFREVATTTTAAATTLQNAESTSYPTITAQSTTMHASRSPGTTIQDDTTVVTSTTSTTLRPTTTQRTTTQGTTSTTTQPPSPTTRATESTTTEQQMPLNHHTMEVRNGQDTNKVQRCPRSQDIHPCECVEVATPSAQEELVADARAEYEVETVAFCKNIRNVEVLREALRGMQGHHLTYLVMDSVHLPPFPNDLFKNVGIGWMEVLNSTMQFQQKFFQCYEQGCT